MHQSIILLACGVEQNSRDSEGWGNAGRRNNARVAKRGYPFQIAFIIWEALPTPFCREVSKSGIVHIEQAPEIGCQLRVISSCETFHGFPQLRHRELCFGGHIE